MKKLFFVLIISSLIPLATFTFAEDKLSDAKQQCLDMFVPPEIIFTTSYGKLIYDNSLTKNELSHMAQQAGIFEKGVFAAGLALVNINSEYELSTITKTTDKNEHCILPQRLNVYIGFSRPIIYLAKELQPETCTYNLVLRHEQVHQQINKQALEYFIPLIRQKLNEIALKIPPVYVSSTEAEDKKSAELTQQYYDSITPLVNHLRDQILQEQRKLDNRINYKMESNICRLFNQKSRSHALNKNQETH